MTEDKLEWFLGIDPGFSGGLALVSSAGDVQTSKMPTTERDTYDWLVTASTDKRIMFAAIEEQRPRPTKFFNKKTRSWQASILKSTCQLYGHYMQLRMLLIATGLSLETPSPVKWQRYFGMIKGKAETSSAWKNRLKRRAQELFPKAQVILATADALLLADYIRQKRSSRATRVVDEEE